MFNEKIIVRKYAMYRFDIIRVFIPCCLYSSKRSSNIGFQLFFKFRIMFQVWFQNRRAKFRKQERLAQQKTTQSSNSTSDNLNCTSSAKNDSKSNGILTKDMKPSTPSTPNSNTSLSSSNGDLKSISSNSGTLERRFSTKIELAYFG